MNFNPSDDLDVDDLEEQYQRLLLEDEMEMEMEMASLLTAGDTGDTGDSGDDAVADADVDTEVQAGVDTDTGVIGVNASVDVDLFDVDLDVDVDVDVEAAAAETEVNTQVNTAATDVNNEDNIVNTVNTVNTTNTVNTVSTDNTVNTTNTDNTDNTDNNTTNTSSSRNSRMAILQQHNALMQQMQAKTGGDGNGDNNNNNNDHNNNNSSAMFDFDHNDMATLTNLVVGLEETIEQIQKDWDNKLAKSTSKLDKVTCKFDEQTEELRANIGALEEILVSEVVDREAKLQRALKDLKKKLTPPSDALSVDSTTTWDSTNSVTTGTRPTLPIKKGVRFADEDASTHSLEVFKDEFSTSSSTKDLLRTNKPHYQETFSQPAQDSKKGTMILHRDTYSFILMAPTRSPPFCLALGVWILQLLVYTLILANTSNTPIISTTSSSDNHDIEQHASSSSSSMATLRIAQLVALILIVFTQSNVLSSMELVLGGLTHELLIAVPYATRWKWLLDILARWTVGSLGLTTSMWVIVVTSTSVLSVVANFIVMTCLSLVDPICFVLSRLGFLGRDCEAEATLLLATTYNRPNTIPTQLQRLFYKYWKPIVRSVSFVLLVTGWCIILQQQKTGTYLCSNLNVQFSDTILPTLGTFSGIYDKQTNTNPVAGWLLPAQRVDYIERRSGGAKFTYCQDMQVWVFVWTDHVYPSANHDQETILTTASPDWSSVNACQDWKARSSKTTTFDLTETAHQPWYTRDDNGRDNLLLEPLTLSCADCSRTSNSCNGRGTCRGGLCSSSCQPGYFGANCEFPIPCPSLSLDYRFAGSRSRSRRHDTQNQTFQMLWIEDSESEDEKNDNKIHHPVTVYDRPVYVEESTTGLDYDGELSVVLFTGRRWAMLSLSREDWNDIPQKLQVTDNYNSNSNNNTKAILARFFNDSPFHAHFSNFLTTLLSEPIDQGTPLDRNSPIYLKWYVVAHSSHNSIQSPDKDDNDKTRNNKFPSPVDGEPFDFNLVCSTCDENHPCLFDGVCGIDGHCQCSPGSFGTHCEDAPIGNGHCDDYFNSPEFDWDGGDCCDAACVSSDLFVCGTELSGFASAGYARCKAPRDKFRQNGNAFVGKPGANAGFQVALSNSGNVMAVAGMWLDQEIQLLDKDGSEWKLRSSFRLKEILHADTFIPTGRDYFLKQLQIREIKQGRVNTPLSKIPVAVSVFFDMKPSSPCGSGVAYVFCCENEDCVEEFNLSGVSWLEMSSLGALSVLTDDCKTNTSTIEVQSCNEWECASTDSNHNFTFEYKAVQEVRMSDDGTKFAVLSVSPSYATIKLQIFQWTGMQYEQMGSDLFVGYFSETEDDKKSIYPWSFALSGEGTVLALALCTTPRNLEVYEWDRRAGWQQREPPPIGNLACNWDSSSVSSSQYPTGTTSYLDLSRNGKTLAFGGGFLDTKANTMVFDWVNNSRWEPLGGAALRGGKENAISLSGDGVLAVGLPFSRFDNAGTVQVYSRPTNKKCDQGGGSLLRVSLGTQRQGLRNNPGRLAWYVVDQESGDIMIEGTSTEFETVISETCVDADKLCYSFHIFNDDGFGILPPGGYALFLDGGYLETEKFEDGFRQEALLGKCATNSTAKASLSCPEGTAIIEVYQTLEKNPSGLGWKVHDESSDRVFLSGGPYPEDWSKHVKNVACVAKGSGDIALTFSVDTGGVNEGDLSKFFRWYVDGVMQPVKAA